MILMQPEYRGLIDPRYKRKIETLVRKSAGLASNSDCIEEQQLSATSPCPFCSSQVVMREMTCVSCTNQIPFCIATGYHITRDELTFCPKCEFPAILGHLKKIVTDRVAGSLVSAVTYDLPSDSSSSSLNLAVEPHTQLLGRTGSSTSYNSTATTTSVNTTALTCPMCSMAVSLSELTLASKEKIDSFLNASKSA